QPLPPTEVPISIVRRSLAATAQPAAVPIIAPPCRAGTPVTASRGVNGESGGEPPAVPAGAPSPRVFRDGRGRFTKGNPGGRGNPFNRRLAAMRQLFCRAISAREIHALARYLIGEAFAGDRAAASLVLAYLIGRPTKAVDPDTLDVHEWRLHQDKYVPHT